MRSIAALVALLLCPAAHAAPLTIYGNALPAGWQDYSWTTHSLSATAQTHSAPDAISFEPDGWGGVSFVDPTNNYRFTDYQSLTFWIRGNGGGNQRLQLFLALDGFDVASFNVDDYIAGGAISATAWRQVTIPFDATQLTHGAFDGFTLMDFTGTNQAGVFVDDIVVNERTSAAPTASLSVSVDPGAVLRPVNPEIYGVNFGDDAQHADLHYPVRRHGGNSVTRYNWQWDIHNTAYDYFWMNIPDGSSNTLPNGSTADQFVDATRQYGGAPLITISTIGWTPKASGAGDRIKLWSYSVAKYGPQDVTECSFYGNPCPFWAQTDAGNGECHNVVNNTGHCVNGLIVGNDPHDTSMSVTTTFAQDWIAHLISHTGATAGNGGVKYYALDNEAMLWNSTHRDVHPTPPDYDEIWTRGRDYALAIKAADPGAKVFGPVTWGWCDLFSSAKDAATGVSCIDGPDRQAHGGIAFVEWYLKQSCDYGASHSGLKPIDYLDVHYYPQGNVAGLSGGNSSELPDDAARRLRSVKELYDPTWVSESWIGQSGGDNKPGLIPRLRASVALRCAGTKIALTEYKWGPDNGVSGALAQAEALAIFGREGLDFATRWVAPDVGSRAEMAFRMFLDYDGANSRVVGDAVSATSSNVDELGAYAVHKSNDKLFVVLINKATGPRDIALTFAQPLNGAWTLYRFDGASAFGQAASNTIAGATLTLPAVPGRSANLLVLPAPSAVSDVLFQDSFE